MAMKPEDVLQAIQAVRGDAICVPTMTTSPAWRRRWGLPLPRQSGRARGAPSGLQRMRPRPPTVPHGATGLPRQDRRSLPESSPGAPGLKRIRTGQTL